MNTTDLYEWLRWRLREVEADIRHDHEAVASGGAGYPEGRRAGQAQALRDCIDMVESLAGAGDAPR